jgi:hypothetical protein
MGGLSHGGYRGRCADGVVKKVADVSGWRQMTDFYNLRVNAQANSIKKEIAMLG